jgi:protein arginine kinase activator
MILQPAPTASGSRINEPHGGEICTRRNHLVTRSWSDDPRRAGGVQTRRPGTLRSRRLTAGQIHRALPWYTLRMVCDYCGSPGKIRLVVQGTGGPSRKSLCVECAQTLGVEPTAPRVRPSREELLSGPAVPWDDNDRECPTCGTTLRDIRAGGVVGCADCYRVFRDRIVPEECRGGQLYSGRVPAALERARDRHATRQDLQALLEGQIAAEAFEEAAVVRDRIAALNAEDAGDSMPARYETSHDKLERP